MQAAGHLPTSYDNRPTPRARVAAASLSLGILLIVLATLIAIFPNRILKGSVLGFAQIGLATPNFLLALVLVAIAVILVRGAPW